MSLNKSLGFPSASLRGIGNSNYLKELLFRVSKLWHIKRTARYLHCHNDPSLLLHHLEVRSSNSHHPCELSLPGPHSSQKRELGGYFLSFTQTYSKDNLLLRNISMERWIKGFKEQANHNYITIFKYSLHSCLRKKPEFAYSPLLISIFI